MRVRVLANVIGLRAGHEYDLDPTYPGLTRMLRTPYVERAATRKAAAATPPAGDSTPPTGGSPAAPETS